MDMTTQSIPETPAIYRTVISHVRTAPLHNVFRYRSYSWLVDVDNLPRLPHLPRLLAPLAGFASSDHLGDLSRTLRQNVDAFLAAHGIDLDGGKVLLLSNARVFGYVFNPLSVFWCHDADGRPVCVIAEVHNTYGERHCYLLRPDSAGAARATKEFYVSPFNDVDGEYRMTLPVPGAALRLVISLEREGQSPFVATVIGERRDATTREVLRAALEVPLAPLRVAAQIRWQGIRLWARGLPIRPRPVHQRQEAV
ncbi:DUF1365 domain-containing protein [Rhodococcus sp. W8901]|uniref:DUF1365 domain-containing protein n=1 Tax=Rhodococcus sp. W8901 TaxID=2742603 RepID=UPI001C2EA7D9|nr:DUF1365 domain-containing protein [Rhodococcus sp. W8901]